MSAHNKLRKQLYSSVGPVLLAAMSLATTDASWAACIGSGSADDHANKMPHRSSNSGQSAAVVRHQLGQSGSRGILSGRSFKCGD